MTIAGPKLPRRDLLTAAGRAGTALAATNMLRTGASIVAPAAALLPARANAAGGAELVQPTEIRSQNGVLDATLKAAPGVVRLGPVTFPGFLYNNAYLPPLLRVRLGDVMRIHFQNELPDDPSNLHFHGMLVSPQGNSDNVFIHVHPGMDFQYEVKIPANDRQGPGLLWYHPHVHGVVDEQVLGGLSGGLVVDGFEKYYPILKDLPERFIFIKHYISADGEIISLNGQINPNVTIKPGEVQFWRIAHIGASLFIKFAMAGLPLYVIATDGHPMASPKLMTEIFISPGQRIDAIVIGPAAGEYAVRTIPFQNQAWKAPDAAQQIGTVVATGTPVTGQPTAKEILALQVQGDQWIDVIRKTPIARRRVLDFSRSADRQTFMINGQVMNEDRIDETVKLGDTEEWTVVNTDQQYHSFHIHQTAFLVTEINGVPQQETSLRDTFPVPPATEIGYSSLKVVIPFTDPIILGKFVYHCHAVDHEDKGMMGIIEVVA
jgi:FtsP/CotA-like multicopper oxidase with cupredoxin domain